MTIVISASYIVLICLIILEGLILQETLRRTISIKRILERAPRGGSVSGLPSGTTAPHFSAPILGTDRYLTTNQLKGSSCILFFVAPTTETDGIRVDLHALWHKSEGHLCVICNGQDDQCKRILSQEDIRGFAHGHIPVALDLEGKIAKSFRITETPEAVELDSAARVRRYGRRTIIDERSSTNGASNATSLPEVIEQRL